MIKSVKFLGDLDNNITEVCVPAKFARWVGHLASKVTEENRVLGTQYQNCNPLIPRWENIEAIPTDVQRKRLPQHVKNIADQWYQCAKRAKREAIRDFYKKHLTTVANQDRHLWDTLVKKMTVDETMESFPRVEGLDLPAPIDVATQQAAVERPNKRKVAKRRDPATTTPISAARKRKEPKQNENANGNENEVSKLKAAASKETVPEAGGGDDPWGYQRVDNTLGADLNQRVVRKDSEMTPAGLTHRGTGKNKERELGKNAEGDKENMAPPC